MRKTFLSLVAQISRKQFCGSGIIFSDPDRTFQVVPDPDPVSDPT
jgi:hypothetical protein